MPRIPFVEPEATDQVKKDRAFLRGVHDHTVTVAQLKERPGTTIQPYNLKSMHTSMSKLLQTKFQVAYLDSYGTTHYLLSDNHNIEFTKDPLEKRTFFNSVEAIRSFMRTALSNSRRRVVAEISGRGVPIIIEHKSEAYQGAMLTLTQEILKELSSLDSESLNLSMETTTDMLSGLSSEEVPK